MRHARVRSDLKQPAMPRDHRRRGKSATEQDSPSATYRRGGRNEDYSSRLRGIIFKIPPSASSRQRNHNLLADDIAKSQKDAFMLRALLWEVQKQRRLTLPRHDD